MIYIYLPSISLRNIAATHKMYLDGLAYFKPNTCYQGLAFLFMLPS